MQGNVKEWLVRTRTGEIIGPFTQRELVEELGRRTFTVDDEIAPSLGHWISAQALGNRDAEEFTHTSTRSQAFTRSIHTSTGHAAPQTAQTNTEKIARDEQEELTPTPPDFERPRFDVPRFEPPPVRKARRGQREFGLPSRVAPLVTALFILGGAWALVSQLRSREKPVAGGTLPAPTAPQNAPGDSPFLKNVYEMINRGETRQALQQLTQYHEKSGGKGGLDYLIPYSALLIMEGESLGRARKFLEQVIEANTTAQNKAAAHHWLGYLHLSQEGEADAAETHFLDSLQLNTKDAASRFNLGRAYLKQGKYSPALDYFQLAELEKPDVWLIHIYKGRAKAELGNVDEARLSFQKAIACSPDRWISYMYYAVFQLIKLNDVEGAQVTIKKMLTRDPKFEVNSPPPWGFFQEKVDYAEYLSAFNQIMARAAGEEKELGKRYISYLNNNAQGDEGDQIIKVAENKGGLMAKVLALKVTLDRDVTADEIRHAANRLPPALSDFGYYAYVLRGEARLRLGNFLEAQTDFKRALELEPKSALAHFSMAVLLKRMQRQDESLTEMRDLLGAHPGYIPAIVFSKTF